MIKLYRHPFQFLVIALVLLFTLVAFQNCSKMDFTSTTTNKSSLKSENGGGYSGLLPGIYYHMTPDFTCEQKPAAVASLEISKNSILLTENKELQCGAIKKNLDLNLVDGSIFQSEIVGFEEGIYESKDGVVDDIPANLVEVWCRNTKDITGIETLTYFDRTSGLAVNRIYYADKKTDDAFELNLIPDFSVARTIAEKTVIFKDKNGFELTVYRDQPAPQIGLFIGHLNAVINNQTISQETYCRLGGTLSPSVWPSKQIVGYHVNTFAISPDLNTFAFSSYSGGNSAQVYSALSSGAGLKKVSDLLGTEQAHTWFSYSPNGKAIVYEVTDLQQAVGLRSIPLTGGIPTLVSPPIVSSVGAKIITSSTQNKFIFQWGFARSTRPMEVYSVNPDGTGLVKISPNVDNITEFFLNMSYPPGTAVGDYVIADYGTSRFNRKQYAMAVDGTNTFLLPETDYWATSDGTFAIGANSINNQVRIINLVTKEIYTLPAGYTWQKKITTASTIIATRTSTTTKAKQLITISLTTGKETILCPQTAVHETYVAEIGNGGFLFLNYEMTSRTLDVYRVENNYTTCSKINSTLITKFNLDTILSVAIAPDQQKIAALLNGTDGSGNQLIYIPLNGRPSLIVDTPTYKTATIHKAIFLNDSKSIIYYGSQIKPALTNVFIWTAP